MKKRKAAVRWPDDDEIHFMNVDLDVYSRWSLQPLADGFGERACQLYVGPVGRHYGGHFELASSYKKSVDALIVGLIRLIERLPRAGRQAWAKAHRRDFNIGIQGGLKPRYFELALKPETLRLIETVNARLVVTVYAAEDAERRTDAATMTMPPNDELQRTRPAQAMEPRR